MRRRSIILLFSYILLFTLLIIRIVDIQYFKSEDLNLKANSQHSYTEVVQELKYNIFDTKGVNLVNYDNKQILVIDILSFKRENNSTPLEEIYALDYILRNYNKSYDLMKILRDGEGGKKYFTLDKESLEKIEMLKEIKGIYSYDYSKVHKGEPWNIVTMLIEGIDKGNEGSLQGDLYNIIKDNTGSTISYTKDDDGKLNKEEIKSEKGNTNIYLTLDREIEDTIKGILEKEEFKKFKDIGVALMESSTGKIRAMVQKDDKRPNVLLGSATENGFAPGSIFKLVVLEGALNEKLISPNEKFTCKYSPNLPCKKSHGELTVEEALIQSCNNIFAEIGTRLGSENIIKYGKAQGLYEKVLPFKGDKEAKGDYVISKEDEGGATNISIGQNMRITPLQGLGIASTVTNGGKYVKPTIVEKVIDGYGEEKKEFQGEATKVFDNITSSYVKSAMKKVITDEKGTGKNAFIGNNLDMGGKTGTATRMEPVQNEENSEDSSNGKEEKEGLKKYNDGWFIGYFKIKNKYYSMVVFVKDIGETHGGGDTAVPIFREVVKELSVKK